MPGVIDMAFEVAEREPHESELRTLRQAVETSGDVIGLSLFPDNFGVLLLDQSRGCLVVPPSHSGGAEAREMVFPLGQGITGQVAATGAARRIADVTTDADYTGADPLTRFTAEERKQLIQTIFDAVYSKDKEVVAIRPKPEYYDLLSVTGGDDGIRTRGLGLDRAAC